MITNKGALIAARVLMGETGPAMSDAEMLLLSHRLQASSKLRSGYFVVVGASIIAIALLMAAVGLHFWLSQ